MEGERSFVTQCLLDRVCPNIDIEEDEQGYYVNLALAYGPNQYLFSFDIVDYENFYIALGHNAHRNYRMDEDGLYLDNTIARIFYD